MLRNIPRNLWHVNFKKVNMFYSNFDCQFQHQVLTSYFTWIKKFTFFLCNFFQHMQLLSYFNKFSEYIEIILFLLCFVIHENGKTKDDDKQDKKGYGWSKIYQTISWKQYFEIKNSNIFHENILLLLNLLSSYKFNLTRKEKYCRSMHICLL